MGPPSKLIPPSTAMSFTPGQSDDVAIATIRTLAADVVAKANSGHPGLTFQSFILIVSSILRLGAPMGMAPAAHVLFSRYKAFRHKIFSF